MSKEEIEALRQDVASLAAVVQALVQKIGATDAAPTAAPASFPAGEPVTLEEMLDEMADENELLVGTAEGFARTESADIAKTLAQAIVTGWNTGRTPIDPRKLSDFDGFIPVRIRIREEPDCDHVDSRDILRVLAVSGVRGNRGERVAIVQRFSSVDDVQGNLVLALVGTDTWFNERRVTTGAARNLSGIEYFRNDIINRLADEIGLRRRDIMLEVDEPIQV